MYDGRFQQCDTTIKRVINCISVYLKVRPPIHAEVRGAFLVSIQNFQINLLTAL